jgi:3-oxoacyl-(acyl-carrier-protein) synthase
MSIGAGDFKVAALSKRIVVTGMSINTAIGDELDVFYKNLLAGRSAISKWSWVKNGDVYSKVGGDLSGYDVAGKVARLREKIPERMYKRLRQLTKKAPFSTGISMTCAADAWQDAGLGEAEDPTRTSVLVGGHNLNERYMIDNYRTFQEEPDYIDSMAALLMLDTDHAGSVSEVLGAQGASYTMGGACASANMALRAAIDEIRYHEHDTVALIGPVLDFSEMGLHAMALMGAISFTSFNDTPELASRPYDLRREGFIPSHGAAALILESLDHALARGARIYAEVLGCTSTSDASHLPSPSTEGQARTISRLLGRLGIAPQEVDYVCAHATSTPQGDLSEINAIKTVFGDHAPKLKINAPKSMLGHTCWSAPAVETVSSLLQMQGGWLHPSINIEAIDPAIELNVCANHKVEHRINLMLKNSFGFGGLNSCALYRRFDPKSV